MTTVAQQAGVFLAGLQTRKRNPVKPATIKAYDGILRNWIVPNLGAMQLADTNFGQSMNTRKNWCRRAGVGFQIPGTYEEVLELPMDFDVDTEDAVL